MVTPITNIVAIWQELIPTLMRTGLATRIEDYKDNMADEHVSFNDLLNSLPIDTSGSSVVPGRYITQVGVQWGSNDITLLFFEAKFPLAPFSDSIQNRTFLESLNYIPAECVGRMILSVERAEILSDLLRNALDSARLQKQHQFFSQMEGFLRARGIYSEFEELLKMQAEKQAASQNEQEEN